MVWQAALCLTVCYFSQLANQRAFSVGEGDGKEEREEDEERLSDDGQTGSLRELGVVMLWGNFLF